MLPLSVLGRGGAAQAQSADYKALVCVFLYGAWTATTWWCRWISAGYAPVPRRAHHRLGREPRAIGAPSDPAVQRGHAVRAASGSRAAPPLFAQGRLAILANVGPLNEPTTRANYLTKRPDNLFSHSDQQNQWQSSVSSGPSRTRLGRAHRGPGRGSQWDLPGRHLDRRGESLHRRRRLEPARVARSGGITLQGFNNTAAANARLAAMQSILAADGENAYVKATADISSRAIALSTVVNPDSHFHHVGDAALLRGAGQFHRPAALAGGKAHRSRAQTGARRQVFFVSLGGFDTHATSSPPSPTSWPARAGAALFHDAIAQLGWPKA
jgi:uncharacterized protein (DUF1501 family)